MDERDRESAFYLLISNLIPAASSREEDWHFPMLGITIVQNDYAEKLFSNASELSQHGLKAEEGTITIRMGNIRAVASLERKLVYWDPIHVLKIINSLDPFAC